MGINTNPQLKLFAKEMRKNPTLAEKVLWQELRNRQIEGVKFRRQHIIDDYILDFFSHEVQLGIEVDGDIHQVKSEKNYDGIRSGLLRSRGIKILRFKNQEVLHFLERVISTIRSACRDNEVNC